MAPIGNPHGYVVDELTDRLTAVAHGKALVRVQGALRLSNRTELQPDVSLLKLPSAQYREKQAAASDALLVIEVSDTTLRKDLHVEVPLYAQHGVPEVCIIDLQKNCVRFYRNLVDGQYQDVTVSSEPQVANVPGGRAVRPVTGRSAPSGRSLPPRVPSEYHAGLADRQLSASAYVISNHLTLWNDFTHYLVDPINGDQEEQHEDRVTIGGEASYTRTNTLAGVRNDLLAGLHVRNDGINVLRLPTDDRVLLTATQLAAVDYPSSYSEQDQVRLNSFAAYLQATTHWTGWLRSVVGLREDEMTGSDVGTNVGTAGATLAEPKANLIFRPLRSTELYASWGRGFHSDDLRGVLQARRLGIGGAPLIARQTGEEVGVRELFAPNLTVTLALWRLDAQSELTYDPDVGQDTAGPASRRYGEELNVTYQATRWLEFYGDYSPAHARFDTPYDDGTGHIGYYLPNAPFADGSLDVYVNHLGPWSAGLALRCLGAFPLTADDHVQGHGYHEWNGQVLYQLPRGWNIGLLLDNLLDEKANAAEFYYVYRLQAGPATGTAGVTVYPLEPGRAR